MRTVMFLIIESTSRIIKALMRDTVFEMRVVKTRLICIYLFLSGHQILFYLLRHFEFFFLKLIQTKWLISFDTIIKLGHIQSMQRPPIFSNIDKKQQDHQEIVNKIARIKKQLTQLTDPTRIKEIQDYYSFFNLKKLEDMILKISQQSMIIDQYTKECAQITQLYACHILTAQLSPTSQTLNRFKNSLQKLEKTQLFNFPLVFYNLSFQLLVEKLQSLDKKPFPETIKNQTVVFKDFTNASKQKLVIDSCVGCNSWFYKYHMIESILNTKAIPVYFIYNKSQQYVALEQKKLIRAPFHQLLIDIKDFSSYEKVLLNKILNLLNNKGGYLMIGCQKMQYIVDNKLLPQQALIQNPKLNDIHFVIGQNLTQGEKQQFPQRIQEIIKQISPLVSLNQQIEVRYLSVIDSKYNHGTGLNKIYKSDEKDRYVILIAVKPSTGFYQPNNHQIQEESQPTVRINRLQQIFQQSTMPNQQYSGYEVQYDMKKFEKGESYSQFYNQSAPSKPASKEFSDQLGMDVQQIFGYKNIFYKHPCQYKTK